jgi:hypothetical protein
VHLGEHSTAESALESWPQDIQKLKSTRPKQVETLQQKLDRLQELLKSRKNIKARNITPLLELELLEEVDGGYVTPADIEARLERYLRESGQMEAERLQREKYERERQAWRSPRPIKTVLIPSPPVNDAPAVERTCYLDADGLAQHIDPLCDDDCSVSFGHAQRVKELSAA